jgi:hypothetical protein
VSREKVETAGTEAENQRIINLKLEGKLLISMGREKWNLTCMLIFPELSVDCAMIRIGNFDLPF